MIRAAGIGLSSIGIVTAIMLAGILASGVAAMLLQTRHQQDHELAFTRDASALAASTQVETNAAFGRVNDVASFVSVAGVPSQAEFQRYLREADLIGKPWLERIAFIQPVPREQLAAFLARERRQSGQLVEPRLRNPDADEYWLVSRTVAPFDDLIGVDIKDIPGFDSRLSEVGASGNPRYRQLTQADAAAINLFVGTPNLVSSSADVMAGVLPVKSGTSDNHLGWLLVQVRTSEIVSAAEQSPLSGELRLLNARDPNEEVAFPLDGGSTEVGKQSFVQSFSGARLQWELLVWSQETAGLSTMAVAALVLGILASLAIGLLLALQDKTRRVRNELSRSEQDRRKDVLTGLPNRIGLGEALDDALEGSQTTAVLFCDIDRFKVINDSLGHQAGDELLRIVAQRLRSSLRNDDVVGRFGGDEFVVICKNLREGAEAEQVADRILTSIAAPLKIQGTDVEVAASIGIALSTPDERRTCHEMLRDADAAMYAAKKTRSGQRSFDGALRKSATDRLDIEGALRATLRDDLLRVEYQPIVAAVGHRLVGLEALARFDEPTLNAAGPERVIPIAEEAGLIGVLGEKVLNVACEQMAAWNELCPDAAPLQVSVNVAEPQLRDPEFAGTVRRTLHAFGLLDGQLVLELPETAINSDMRQAMTVVPELADTGAQISIDDFGSGRSSLTDIIRLTSISELKMDRSLVGGPAAPSVRGLLISAVTEIARGLDARLVAVGVETQEQLASVTAAGVERAQGFLFSRSLRPEHLHKILADPERRVRAQLRSESEHVAVPTIDS